MELNMRVIHTLPTMLPAILALAACDNSPPPETTQIVVQQPARTIIPSAPMPPPPPMSELVPPPPPSSVPTIWQPGHWRYSGIGGNPWTWESGRYVAVPAGATAWVPGQWQQQGSGWVWREGHWA
jgi:hypothetical protein